MPTAELEPYSVREMRLEDHDEAAKLLNPWFANHKDHLDYSGPTLSFLRQILGTEESLSTWAESPQRAAGMMSVGIRKATIKGKTLTGGHMGPFAVNPFFRRRGVGSALVNGAEKLARAQGLDYLTFMTEEMYKAHLLFEKLGHQRIERFQPLGASIGEVDCPPGVEEVDQKTWLEGRPRRVNRTGAMIERPGALPTDVTAFPIRFFRRGDAGVATVVWPVKVRIYGKMELKRSCQIIDAYGEGYALDYVTAAALYNAKLLGCDGAYIMPSVPVHPTGFRTEGGPWVYRFVKPLNKRAAKLMKGVKAYDQACPCP